LTPFRGCQHAPSIQVRRHSTGEPTPVNAQIGDIVGMSAKMVERDCRNADMRSNSRAALTHLERVLARCDSASGHSGFAGSSPI
jgi:hypothetical protein